MFLFLKNIEDFKMNNHELRSLALELALKYSNKGNKLKDIIKIAEEYYHTAI